MAGPVRLVIAEPRVMPAWLKAGLGRPARVQVRPRAGQSAAVEITDNASGEVVEFVLDGRQAEEFAAALRSASGRRP